VLRVQACQFLRKSRQNRVSCGRCRFWVVLELIIRWIRFLIQSDRFIIFGNVCSFSMDPDSTVQPYSVMLSRVKRVYKLCFKQRVLLAFHIYIESCGG
jgi:ribosomal protein S27AE